MEKRKRVDLDGINRTLLLSVLAGLMMWIGIFQVNSEPELAYIVLNYQRAMTGAFLGAFTAFMVVSAIVGSILDLIEDKTGHLFRMNLFRNSFYMPLVLTLALFIGFYHGATNLYYQYNIVAFAPVFIGSIVAYWIFLLTSEITFGLLLLPLLEMIPDIRSDFERIKKVLYDRKNTSDDRTSSESLSWSFDDDKRPGTDDFVLYGRDTDSTSARHRPSR